MSKIRFEPPGIDEPGYLRRQRKLLELSHKFENKTDPEALDAMIDLLLPYVKEPENRDEAREALWDASEAQFKMLLDLVSGKTPENPT